MMDEPVIVGGGLAGASAAAILAEAGRSPLLLERETQPRHKVCGEFLSHEAQAYLAMLGIDARALGGTTIDRLRLVHGRRVAETALPFTAIGLTRRTLDAALLQAAEVRGARVMRGVQLRAIVRDQDGFVLETQDRSFRARTLLLASGKHEIRGVKRDPTGTDDDLVGFKTYFRLARNQRAALAGHIEVILFRGGYAGLQLVEDDMANVCLLIEKRRFHQCDKDWDTLLAALRDESGHLRQRLDKAEPLLERPLSIARLPYGYVHRSSAAAEPGLFRLGDQFAVIASFSGDGMSIALHCGRAAALAVLHGIDADRYHRRLDRELRGPIGLASTLYRLARPPILQAVAVRAFSLWPRTLAILAARTRVPATAMARAGAGLESFKL